MLKKIPFFILLALFVSCPKAAENWKEGAIYSTPYEGGFTVIKILKVDSGGVHIRMYSNLYPAKPASVNEDELFMVGVDDSEGRPLGMGHAPISHRSFATWDAEFVQQSSVAEEELEGYKLWLEASGGYF